jgi:hypothetical protein
MKNSNSPYDADQMRTLLSRSVEDELTSSLLVGSGASTAATSTVPHNGALNVEEMLFEMKRVLADIPPDPLAEYMRAQGFDPARGALLHLPDTVGMRAHFAPFGPPRYVRFAKLLPFPVMTNPRLKAF